ncbi:MAG: DegT/DnrJ/EryC1/StrS family aminotransferase [Flavobacteriaceae bacterium]|nr:DegT/DnrJ/EryC1/StrS family aminotransferase [Flavobacteriaceae bacterium]
MPGFELFGDAERKEVNEVLETGVLMRYGFDNMRQGRWKAKKLEAGLANRLDVSHVQLVSSGTAAVTVALAVAGVGSGDEVILPTFTFVASFEAVMALGAIPVLVDIDDTLTLDPKAVEAAISDKTKAVMPVHMCGSMADLSALKAICDRHNLILVEDACQAIGGTYNGKALGTIGDLGCFSFDYVKTITCGEGGAVVTSNKDYYLKADHYSDHGHDHIGSDRGAEEHPFLGYNYRISELNAAVGLAQLRRMDEFLHIQKRNYETLKNAIADIPGITFRRVPDGGEESYAFLNFYLPDEDTARIAAAKLKEAGVDGCFYWYDNNWHYVKKWEHLIEQDTLHPLSDELRSGLSSLKNKSYPQSDGYLGRNISCLIKLGWTQEEVDQRADAMKKVLQSVI